MIQLPPYIVCMSAKDESPHIQEVLDAIVMQRPAPLFIYIIDDGSSDDTATIIEGFANRYPIIRFSRNPKGPRNWASKDRNLNKLFAQAQNELGTHFKFVAFQDGDQAPVFSDFFARLLLAAQDGKVGIVGGVVYERNGGQTWRPRPTNSLTSVPGSAMFRREFFEAVDGYVPLEYGGSDWLIQVDAVRLGYKVQVVQDCVIHHYRKTSGVTVKGSFRAGLMDASLGSDPIFEFLKCARRALRPPFIGGVLRFAGFASYILRGRKPMVGPERVRALRTSQRNRLK
jgi:poly-beta-1,6-N-acetyl-D-glucosamine synthase